MFPQSLPCYWDNRSDAAYHVTERGTHYRGIVTGFKTAADVRRIGNPKSGGAKVRYIPQNNAVAVVERRL